MTRWAIFGAGAQGRIALETILAGDQGAEVVFIDDRSIGKLLDRCVFTRQWLIDRSKQQSLQVLVTIGRNDVRLRVSRELSAAGCGFGTLIHPSAIVMPSTVIESGAFVMAAAVVNTGAIVREHAVVNSRVVVEHDCEIGPAASLAPGVVMGGRVRVEAGAFVGTGAVLVPRVKVGEGSLVGAGAVVTRDVPPGVVAYGNPARVVRPFDPNRDWPRVL